MDLNYGPYVSRRLRFGCVAREPAPSLEAWLARVRRIDAMEFDVLLVPDHLGAWPPFTPLVAAAHASDRLHFGTLVLNSAFWNLALLAREVAAADTLTTGRLELGLGAGHAEQEFTAAGLRYPSPEERVDRLAEMVPLLRRLLAGEEVTAQRRFGLEKFATGLTTVQQPVPVLVGGNGDRLLRVAARHADIVSFVGFSPAGGAREMDVTHFSWDGLAERVAYVRHHAEGRDLELSVLVQQVVVSDDRVVAGEGVAADLEQHPALVLDSPFVMLGRIDEIAHHVRRLREELGISYITVFESSAAALAPVVALLK